MARTIKGILIETDKRSVHWVDFKGTLDHAYELLNIHRGSRLIQAVPLFMCGIPYAGDLYVDEEGLLRPETRAMGAFLLGQYPAGLHGRGLLLGKRGSSWATAERFDIETIQSITTFAE